MKRPIIPIEYQSAYKETGRLRLLGVLFKYPDKEFSLSDLAKEAGVAKSNIGEVLEELNKLGFIEITKLRNIWRIRANQGNWYFIRSKIVYNLDFIYSSGLIEFLNERYKNPRAIILFGSFRKGEDISGSDIDIAIETDEAEDYKVERLKELINFEKISDRNIQVHIFDKNTVDTNLLNNIINGIVLLGFLTIIP